MTMQRHDYERVSTGLRTTRDETLTSLHEIKAVNGTADAAYTEEVVKRSYREAAIKLADSFHQMNPRFKIVKFFNDALGDDEANFALAEYQARQQGDNT